MALARSTRITIGAIAGSLIGFYVTAKVEDDYKVLHTSYWQDFWRRCSLPEGGLTDFGSRRAGETQGKVQRRGAEGKGEKKGIESMISRKNTTQNEEDVLDPPWGPFGRDFVLGVVSGFGKLWLQAFGDFTVTNHETFLQLVSRRSRKEGLITVSNHTSTLDDPFVISALLPWSFFYSEREHKGVRWSMCARSVCFKNRILEEFFRNGKVMPVERGEGLDQPIISRMAERLIRGDWVHVFPQGKVVPRGDITRLKWGTAKLLCECEAAGKRPKLLPFYHLGMEEVKPIGQWLPAVGKSVHVVVGEPLDLSDLTRRCNQNGEDQEILYAEIMQRIEDRMKELELQARDEVRHAS